MVDIKSLNREELRAFIIEKGEKKYRADQIFDWIHRKNAGNTAEMSNIPKSLKKLIDSEAEYITLKSVLCQRSALDGTAKYLFPLSDGNEIESVFMEYHDWNSVCISSQAGCNMGCRFCASTIGGCARNLKASEMLEQIYAIQRESGKKISNVVVMGSGEPLDNFDNLIRFLELITDEKGFNMGERHITVSTCGLVPGIKRLAGYKKQLTLAISLHAPNDEIRRRLMPVADQYSIKELMEAVKYYYDMTGRRITFEYALSKGINDGPEQADELSGLLSGMNCHVNLIPVNPVREREITGSSKAVAAAFKSKLEKNGINVTIRREMGRDIDGACGQLRRKHLEAGFHV